MKIHFQGFRCLLFFILLTGILPSYAQNWVQRGQNLDGASKDSYGYSASIDAGGNSIVAGSLYGSYVTAYELSGTTWVQKGSTIYGNDVSDRFGESVEMSGNGKSFIAGASRASTTLIGYARVYYWNGTDWEQRGSDLKGTNQFGQNVSISHNGAVVAGSGAYDTRLFYWNGFSWFQKGKPISNKGSVSLNEDGSVLIIDGQVYDFNGSNWVARGASPGGSATSISADGNRIAVGTPNSQQVKTYEWQSTAWVQIGATLTGALNNRFGSSVVLTPDGNTLAVGDHYSDAGGGNSGEIFVYDWTGTGWSQRAQTIEGNAGLGNLGAKPNSIDISDDGKYVVGGAYYANAGNGRVSAYTWCPLTIVEDVVVTCGASYTWDRNGTTYTTDGVYDYPTNDVDGCEITNRLVLTFEDTARTDTTVHLCDGSDFTWGKTGKTYTVDGIYQETIDGVDCPTIYTIDFANNLRDTTFQNVTECKGYYFWTASEEFYTASGLYETILTNQSGCDSVVQLDLVVYPVPTVEETVYSCDPGYTWASNGVSYTTAGDYRDTLASVTGCDSINVLHLFFQEPAIDTTARVYGSFTSPYTGTVYTTSGNFTENLTLNGCPVTYTLDLTIRTISPLAGVYTIDPVDGYFYSFTEAAEALAINGVGGEVIFDVHEAVYDESFTISTVTGSSDVNTISFIGENENVTIRPSSLATYAQFMLVDKVSNIQFENIHFYYDITNAANIVKIAGPAENIIFDSCSFYFNQPPTISYFYGITADSIKELTVTNSGFYGGNVSAFVSNSETIRFENNKAHTMWIQESSDLSLLKNEFSADYNLAYGIYLDRCNKFTISYNKINPGFFYEPIYIINEDPESTAINASLISNNFIYTPRGLYFKGIDSLNIYHNTIISDQDVLVFASYSSGDPSVQNSKIKNNIFVSGTGTAFSSSELVENTAIDHNLYFTGGTSLFTYNGTSYSDLSAWQTAFPAVDQNAQFFEPVFASDTVPHILSATDYRFGDPGVGITDDIDGEARDLSAPVDVGADQYHEVVTGINMINDVVSFSVYPNPSRGPVYIKFAEEITSAQVIVSNNTGQFISTQEVSSRDEVSLGSDPGLYFIQIVTEDGNSEVMKVLVSR